MRAATDQICSSASSTSRVTRPSRRGHARCGRHRHKILAMAGDLHDVVAGLLHGQAGAQVLEQLRRLFTVDRRKGGRPVAREYPGHVVGTGVVRGDDTVVARVLVGHGAELIATEHGQVGHAQLDVVIRVQE